MKTPNEGNDADQSEMKFVRRLLPFGMLAISQLLTGCSKSDVPLRRRITAVTDHEYLSGEYGDEEPFTNRLDDYDFNVRVGYNCADVHMNGVRVEVTDLFQARDGTTRITIRVNPYRQYRISLDGNLGRPINMKITRFE